jgi:DNA-binding CsgD family transcriptional regulator
MKIFGFTLAIDSYLVRRGLGTILNRIHGVRISREIVSVPELTRHLASNRSGFLLISESMFSGVEELIQTDGELLERTILVATREDPGSRHPVHSSIFLSDTREQIMDKITRILDQHSVTGEEREPQALTEREKTIVKMVCQGLTNRQIADRLFLSTHTVTTHRKNISGKLGIKSASGLTIYAIVNNIITIEEAISKPS